MKQVPFGGTGLTVSAMCLGAMHFGTRVPQAEAFALLDAFVDGGGTFVDTSNNYAHWAPGATGDESETLLGQWFAGGGKRDRVILATKVGFDRHGHGAGLRAHQIVRWCEESLRKLQTDVIDVYYAHVDDPATPQEETLAAFDRLVRAGKVRALGASNYDTWRLQQAAQTARQLGITGYAALQQRYTYLYARGGLRSPYPFNTNATGEKLRYLAHAGMPLVAYSCLAGGGYADNSRLEGRYETGERLDKLNAMAAEKGITPGQLMLAWLMHAWMFADRPLTIPLFAAGSIDHLRENLRAADLVLDSTEVAYLNEA